MWPLKIISDFSNHDVDQFSKSTVWKAPSTIPTKAAIKNPLRPLDFSNQVGRFTLKYLFDPVVNLFLNYCNITGIWTANWLKDLVIFLPLFWLVILNMFGWLHFCFDRVEQYLTTYKIEIPIIINLKFSLTKIWFSILFYRNLPKNFTRKLNLRNSSVMVSTKKWQRKLMASLNQVAYSNIKVGFFSIYRALN